MYCSTCGVAVSPELSFCNYCGAQLKSSEGRPKHSIRPESLIFGILATFVFGMIAITMLLGLSKVVLQLEIGEVLLIGGVPFVLLLILESVFIRLLLQHKHDVTDNSRKLQSHPRPTNQLEQGRQHALPEPAASVTENTTRTFAPILEERGKKN